VEWIKKLCKELNVPSLSSYGVQKEHIPEIVEKSAKSSSMQGNPIVLTKEELTHIIEQAL
jgi:alcohol dehydrogenase class IV